MRTRITSSFECGTQVEATRRDLIQVSLSRAGSGVDGSSLAQEDNDEI
jgi:hypothetical protein